MSAILNTNGFYLILRLGDEDVSPFGFVVKPARRMLFSERNGGWRGVKVGPLYFRTYARRPM